MVSVKGSVQMIIQQKRPLDGLLYAGFVQRNHETCCTARRIVQKFWGHVLVSLSYKVCKDELICKISSAASNNDVMSKKIKTRVSLFQTRVGAYKYFQKKKYIDTPVWFIILIMFGHPYPFEKGPTARYADRLASPCSNVEKKKKEKEGDTHVCRDGTKSQLLMKWGLPHPPPLSFPRSSSGLMATRTVQGTMYTHVYSEPPSPPPFPRRVLLHFSLG